MPLFARIASWLNSPADSDTPELDIVEEMDAVDPKEAFDELHETLQAARRALLSHPIYEAVDSVPRLRAFMGFHVFAVWDFMCLAKRLQRDFTSMGPLWRPPPSPEMARFINGVILGEESDVGPNQEAMSHVELYLGAMEEVGASTKSIRRFLDLIGPVHADVPAALDAAGAPRAAHEFVRRTLDVAVGGETVEVLSAFLFGREDLIPEMFERLLPQWKESGKAPQFTYYVERHIELDGDDHGPAARRALMMFAGDDPHAWAAARRAAQDAISARIALWDNVLRELTTPA